MVFLFLNSPFSDITLLQFQLLLIIFPLIEYINLYLAIRVAFTCDFQLLKMQQAILSFTFLKYFVIIVSDIQNYNVILISFLSLHLITVYISRVLAFKLTKKII